MNYALLCVFCLDVLSNFFKSEALAVKLKFPAQLVAADPWTPDACSQPSLHPSGGRILPQLRGTLARDGRFNIFHSSRQEPSRRSSYDSLGCRKPRFGRLRFKLLAACKTLAPAFGEQSVDASVAVLNRTTGH